jgi:hypothetical protein
VRIYVTLQLLILKHGNEVSFPGAIVLKWVRRDVQKRFNDVRAFIFKSQSFLAIVSFPAVDMIPNHPLGLSYKLTLCLQKV